MKKSDLCSWMSLAPDPLTREVRQLQVRFFLNRRSLTLSANPERGAMSLGKRHFSPSFFDENTVVK